MTFDEFIAQRGLSMIAKKDFRHIDEYLWEMPVTFRADMRVPARIYADEALLEMALTERCVVGV